MGCVDTAFGAAAQAVIPKARASKLRCWAMNCIALEFEFAAGAGFLFRPFELGPLRLGNAAFGDFFKTGFCQKSCLRILEPHVINLNKAEELAVDFDGGSSGCQVFDGFFRAEKLHNVAGVEEKAALVEQDLAGAAGSQDADGVDVAEDAEGELPAGGVDDG